MDTIDDAQSAADKFLEVAIRNARPKGRALLPKGSCYFCEEKVSGQKLFCDVDCHDDYQKLQRKRFNSLE